jgi:branched-chain amino acid transport system substrate-binding protein
VDLAAQHRLPATCNARELADLGGLMTDGGERSRIGPASCHLGHLAAAGIGALLAAGSAVAQPKEVKVAMVAPMSGPWARQGKLMQLGADMAVADINAQGGIKALGGAKLRLVVLDAGDSAEKAKDAAQRLVAQEPDVVGGMGRG